MRIKVTAVKRKPKAAPPALHFRAVVITYVTKLNQLGLTTLNNGKSHTWEKHVRNFERMGHSQIVAIGVKNNNHTVTLRDKTDNDKVKTAVRTAGPLNSTATRRSGKVRTINYKDKEAVLADKAATELKRKSAAVKAYGLSMGKPKGLSKAARYMEQRPTDVSPLEWWQRAPKGVQ